MQGHPPPAPESVRQGWNGGHNPAAALRGKGSSCKGGTGVINRDAGGPGSEGSTSPESFLRRMEFVRRAMSKPPLPRLTLKPFSGLLPPPTPRLRRAPLFPLGLCGPRGARRPGTPALSRSSRGNTYPTRHLHGHVRLRGCTSALSLVRPRRARTRPRPPAFAHARYHREAAHAPSRVPGSPVPPGARPLGGRQGRAGRRRHFEQEGAEGRGGAVTPYFLEPTCPPAAFSRAPLSSLSTAGRWHSTLQ